jgi:hypothetical protein
MKLDLALAAGRAAASMSAAEWLTLKTATSMTTTLIGCVCILIFPCTFIHRPDEIFCHLLAFFLQGAGLYIAGTTTLINSNVYENEAEGPVCSLFEPSVTFNPSPQWRLTSIAAGRAAASMPKAEWLTLKAATSMTILLDLCACILTFPELSSIAPLKC